MLAQKNKFDPTAYRHQPNQIHRIDPSPKYPDSGMDPSWETMKVQHDEVTRANRDKIDFMPRS